MHNMEYFTNCFACKTGGAAAHKFTGNMAVNCDSRCKSYRRGD